MSKIDLFKKELGIEDQDVIMVPYGSVVYGTAGPESDEDYMAILLVDKPEYFGYEYHKNKLNIQVYGAKSFQDHLNCHKVHALEGWYLPDSDLSKYFAFNLNLGLLRSEFSHKASHSFVKAKKKIEVEKDYHIGRKSLFHSLRILNFGTQIARKGTIDFSSANDYWYGILKSNRYDWAYFKEFYQPIYNSLATEFRKVSPKD